jgi:flagellar protein FlaG
MAIEPISSAMTYQVQNTQFTKPVTKPEAVDTDVASQDSAVPFDPTTAKIVETQESNTRGQDSNAGENAREAAKEQNQASKEQIKKAVEELNKKMTNSEAVFGIHEETNHVTIKIIDKDTKETIKELPAEKTLDMIAKVWEMAGILVDEKR